MSLENPYPELFNRSIWMLYFKSLQRLKMSAVNLQFNSFIYISTSFFVFLPLSSLAHQQLFVFFFESHSAWHTFSNVLFFYLFLNQPYVSEALMILVITEQNNSVIKKDKNLTHRFRAVIKMDILYVGTQQLQYGKMKQCALSPKFHQAKAPVWNAFTLISFPGSIMVLEIRKAMEDSQLGLISLGTLLAHCSRSIEVNYYTRLNPK